MLIIWRTILFSRKIILGICLSFFLQYILSWPISWFVNLLVPDVFSFSFGIVTCLGALSPAEQEENLLTITDLMVYVASLQWTYNSDSKLQNSCDLIMFIWPLLFKKETRNICKTLVMVVEKAMAPHSSTLAWEIPWIEEPGRLQSMGSRRVRHDWATSLSLFTFMPWRRKWQPTPVFLPGESQGRRSLVGCRLWGCTESDTTEAT